MQYSKLLPLRAALLIFTAGLILPACSAEPAPKADSFLQGLKADYPVSLTKIAEDADSEITVWVHTTNYALPGQAPIGSNGLVVRGKDGVTLIDGAWGELATVALLEAIKAEIGTPVTKLVITHHHPDRIAGVDAAERMGIQVFTHPDTPTLAARAGYAVPNTSVAALKEPQSRTKIGPLEVSYPGAAHAPDNLIVYVPEVGVLYGGCAVRGGESKTLGNIVDADLTAWPQSLRWMKAVYKDAKIVVPGHGKGGDISLPDHTLELLAAKINSDKEQDAKKDESKDEK